MSRGARHTRLRLEEFLLRHTSRFKFFAEAPDSGSRTDILSAILAVELRTASEDQRWQVATRGANLQCGIVLDPSTKHAANIYMYVSNRHSYVHHSSMSTQNRTTPI